MPLLCELPWSVYQSGITFPHYGLNVPSLPTQTKPVYEGGMVTLTIS